MKHFDWEYLNDFEIYLICTTSGEGRDILEIDFPIVAPRTDDNDNYISQIVMVLEKMAENNQ